MLNESDEPGLYHGSQKQGSSRRKLPSPGRSLFFAGGKRLSCDVVSLFYYNRLVFRNQQFHDAPTDQVGHGADAEYDHVAGRFAFKT